MIVVSDEEMGYFIAFTRFLMSETALFETDVAEKVAKEGIITAFPTDMSIISLSLICKFNDFE